MAYFYLHENGQIIRKPDCVVDGAGGGPNEYFDSPFVKRWWYAPDETPKEQP